MPLTEEAARHRSSTIGAGVVILVPVDVCPLLEVSRVVRYLEGQGAGQCGPCVHGLDASASAMESLAVQPRALRNGVSDIPALCGLVSNTSSSFPSPRSSTYCSARWFFARVAFSLSGSTTTFSSRGRGARPGLTRSSIVWRLLWEAGRRRVLLADFACR